MRSSGSLSTTRWSASCSGQHDGLPAQQPCAKPSAAIGTVIRASTVERLASESGFASTEILPIEHDIFRVYHINP